jgi:Bacterial Ig-like domain (group 2)
MTFYKSWSLFSSALISSLAVLLGGCGGGSGGNYPTGIDIAPISPTIAVGDTVQFTATAHFSNGPDQDVTSAANWKTNPTGIATVSAGLAMGVADGMTNVTATYTQGSSTVQITTDLTVTASSSKSMEGTAILFFSSAPEAPETSIPMDGRVLGTVACGSSFSVELTTGLHRFLSADGKHRIALTLRANTPYYFSVPSAGKLELTDGENVSPR